MRACQRSDLGREGSFRRKASGATLILGLLSAWFQHAPPRPRLQSIIFGCSQIQRPGTVAAGAVSILAVIGILVVSTGSIIRNQGNRSETPRGGPPGSSGAGPDGVPGMVRSCARCPVCVAGQGCGTFAQCLRKLPRLVCFLYVWSPPHIVLAA